MERVRRRIAHWPHLRQGRSCRDRGDRRSEDQARDAHCSHEAFILRRLGLGMNDFSAAIGTALTLIAHNDASLREIVILSLEVSLTASICALVIGAPLGTALAVYRFRGRGALIVIANALLGPPPVVVGLAVYLLLSRSGPLGAFGILFTPAAMVIAQCALGTPIVIALVHRNTVGHWRAYGDAMLVDGASRRRTIGPLMAIGRDGLLTAWLAAFGRAIAEVGAIIIVGGNIRGYTRTMTTAIALETSKGDLSLALALGMILIVLSMAVSAVSLYFGRALKGD
jgi:tungstate transport system permease protein